MTKIVGKQKYFGGEVGYLLQIIMYLSCIFVKLFNMSM